MVQMQISFDQIEGCFRKHIVKKLKDRVFKELQKIQEGHDKVSYIPIGDLSGPQNYIVNSTFTRKTLTGLQENTTRHPVIIM